MNVNNCLSTNERGGDLTITDNLKKVKKNDFIGRPKINKYLIDKKETFWLVIRASLTGKETLESQTKQNKTFKSICYP